MRLKGKVALITGGTAGIGKATANLFAREGARLILVGRNQESAAPALADIKNALEGKHISSKRTFLELRKSKPWQGRPRTNGGE